MATKSFRLRRDDRVADATQVLDEKVGVIVKERLLPRIKVQNQIAVQGQGIRFFLFNKLFVGRRCSCFKIETSPSNHCSACFGTGTVGGYTKHGTHLDVLDVTYPQIKSVNVLPNYMANEKPAGFVLIDKATSGYLEARINLKPNIGILDDFTVRHTLLNGTEFRYYLKSSSDPDWVFITHERDVTSRLGNPYIDFRVELRRIGPTTDSPIFRFIYLRYQAKPGMSVLCDIPVTPRQSVLSEYGVDDDWQRQSFWLADTIRRINPGDFLSSLDGSTRWKIYNAKEVAPVDQLTSWDLQTRLLQHYEAPSMVPVGELDQVKCVR